MKANELRIGNLLAIYKTVYEVDFIQSNGIIRFKGDTRPIDLNYGSDDLPIPLTEEWLLKFGFGKWSDGVMTDGGCEIEYNPKTKAYYQFDESTGGRWRINPTQIKFVHQLQNLYFALIGEELTIKETATT